MKSFLSFVGVALIVICDLSLLGFFGYEIVKAFIGNSLLVGILLFVLNIILFQLSRFMLMLIISLLIAFIEKITDKKIV